MVHLHGRSIQREYSQNKQQINNLLTLVFQRTTCYAACFKRITPSSRFNLLILKISL